MANDVMLARAIIEVGAKGVKEAEDQIKILDIALNTLESDYKRGTVGLVEYAKENARLRAQIADLKGGLDMADAALKKYGSQQAAIDSLSKDTTKSTRNVGQGFLELSRAFEDAQYGLRGVLNNIPSTIQMFGGPAGLAAAVSGAAVAVSILGPHLVELAKSFGLLGEEAAKGLPQIDRLAERIQELSDKKVKLAVDRHELDEAEKQLKALKAAKDAFDRAMGMTTAEEKEAGAQFEQNFAEFGGPQALDAVRRQILKEMEATHPNLQAADQRRAEKRELERQLAEEAQSQESANALRFDIEEKQREIAQAEELARATRLNLQQEAEQKTGALFQGTAAGNNAAARNELARRLRQVGSHDLAAMTELSSPEQIGRQESQDAALEQSIEKMRDAAKARNDNNRELIDALHKQAAEGERIGLAGARQAAKEKGTERAAAIKAANAIAKANADAAKAQTGIQAQAERMIAQAAAAGKVRLNDEGKLGMGDFSQLSRMIAKELQRQNPGANPFTAASIANRIAANAEADVGKRMAAMGGQQLTNQQKLLTIATQLDADLARQQQQLLRQGREIDALSRNVATRQRTALSRPGG